MPNGVLNGAGATEYLPNQWDTDHAAMGLGSYSMSQRVHLLKSNGPRLSVTAHYNLKLFDESGIFGWEPVNQRITIATKQKGVGRFNFREERC